MITIVDYGVGNLESIRNMLKRVGIESIISNDSDVISKADKLILPEVGAFDYGMEQLRKSGLVEPLNHVVLQKKTPILGICLGAQLLTEKSEEGTTTGLGWIRGKTVAFDRSKLVNNQKVPHMAWSEVFDYSNSRLFTNMYPDPRFYFVHSYHLELENANDIMVKSNYGYQFPAGIEKDNILGVQFHPEKSHKFGIKIFENFIKYY